MSSNTDIADDPYSFDKACYLSASEVWVDTEVPWQHV